MPVGTKVHKCVQSVKAKGGGVNPYAVCQAATGQSYATGKKLPHHKGASPHRGASYAHKARHGIS